jgi:hypothetical protein
MSGANARVREGMPHFALLRIGPARLLWVGLAAVTALNLLILVGSRALRAEAVRYAIPPVTASEQAVSESSFVLADLMMNGAAGLTLYCSLIVGLWAARWSNGYHALPSSEARRRAFVVATGLGSAVLTGLPLVGAPVLWLATMALAVGVSWLAWAMVPSWPHPPRLQGLSLRAFEASAWLVGLGRHTIGRPSSRVEVVLAMMARYSVWYVAFLPALLMGFFRALLLVLVLPLLFVLQHHAGERDRSFLLSSVGVPHWLPWSNADRARTNLVAGIGFGIGLSILGLFDEQSVRSGLPLFAMCLCSTVAATEAIRLRWRAIALVGFFVLMFANLQLFFWFEYGLFVGADDGFLAWLRIGTIAVQGLLALLFAIAVTRFGLLRPGERPVRR